MLTIIALLVFIYISYNFIKDNFWETIPVRLGFSFIILLLVGSVTLMLNIVLSQISCFSPQENHRDNRSRLIYSIKNTDGVYGRFVLGSGGFNSQEYYNLFVKNENGGNIRWQLRSSDCIIYQTENKSPNIKWQGIFYRPSKWIHIWPIIEWEEDSVYSLYVPTNTIVESFKVN